MTGEPKPEVLLVDDDPQIVALYTEMLEGLYELHTASSGEAALETISDTIDVVLLDRRMPGMSGDEVAEAIREAGYDCRIAMVTALDPDVDIVDMGIDDYLVKPVTASKLRNVIDSLLQWGEYDAVLAEYYEVARKVAVLEKNTSLTDLEQDDDYQRLKERLSTLQAEANELVGGTEGEHIAELLDDTNDEESAAENTEPAGFPSG